MVKWARTERNCCTSSCQQLAAQIKRKLKIMGDNGADPPKIQVPKKHNERPDSEPIAISHRVSDFLE